MGSSHPSESIPVWEGKSPRQRPAADTVACWVTLAFSPKPGTCQVTLPSPIGQAEGERRISKTLNGCEGRSKRPISARINILDGTGGLASF